MQDTSQEIIMLAGKDKGELLVCIVILEHKV